jgi:hypothetical protein
MPTGYGPTAIESAVAGYEGMAKITEDVASKDILSKAYSETTPEAIAQNPMEQKNVLNTAAVLAGQRGLNSLAYSFNKQAGMLTENVQKEQLNDIKVKQSRLNYADQFLNAASNEEELKNAFAPIKDESAQMQIQSIIRNPNLPFEKKKEILGNLTKTVNQRLAAERLAVDAEYKERLADNRDQETLRKIKKDAAKQSGAGGGDEKALNKELGDLDKREASDLTKVETNPYVTDKEAAKANIRAEYEKKRNAVRERRGGGKEPTKKTEFVEGQVYEDANGNRAKYSKGRWIPVK